MRRLFRIYLKKREGGDNGENVIRMHEKLERPESADWLDLQGEDAGFRSRHVRYDQRHRILNEGTPNTKSVGPLRYSSTRKTSITISGSWR